MGYFMRLNKLKWTNVLLACGWLLALALPATAAKPKLVPTEVQQHLVKTRASPDLTVAALQHGSKVATFCANCHGDKGNSLHADTPNLAAQNPTFLLNQMMKFAYGARRHEFMEGLIRAMTPEELVGTALYYTRQVVTTTTDANPAQVARGKTVYDRACVGCHTANGHGNEYFARLAGQQERYVLFALKRYREAARRHDPLMTSTTHVMTDSDMQAVAAYIATMD